MALLDFDVLRDKKCIKSRWFRIASAPNTLYIKYGVHGITRWLNIAKLISSCREYRHQQTTSHAIKHSGSCFTQYTPPQKKVSCSFAEGLPLLVVPGDCYMDVWWKRNVCKRKEHFLHEKIFNMYQVGFSKACLHSQLVQVIDYTLWDNRDTSRPEDGPLSNRWEHFANYNKYNHWQFHNNLKVYAA